VIVPSMPAPVASGGSGRRVGLAPTGNAPPCHGAIVGYQPIMSANITVSYEIRRHVVSRLYPVVLWQSRRSGTPKCALRAERNTGRLPRFRPENVSDAAEGRRRVDTSLIELPAGEPRIRTQHGRILRLALASSAAFKSKLRIYPSLHLSS
jgi:hypothetical protein